MLLRVLLLCIPLLCGLSPLLADTSASIPFGLHGYEPPIGRHLDVLKDRDGSLSPQQALSDTRFVPQRDEVPNLGLDASTYWVRFSVHRVQGSGEPVLQMMNPDVDELDLFMVTGENTVLELASAGLVRPVSLRRDGRKELIFDLPVPHGQERTFLVRIRSLKQLTIPFHVRSRVAQAQYETTRNIWVGLYLGVILVMALYNLFIYFSIRDRSYLTYVAYILLVGITQLNFLGLGKSFIWPDATWWSVNASLILTLLTAFAASEFMRRFVDIPGKAPKLNKAFPWFYGFFAFCILAYVTIMPLAGYTLAQAGAGLFASYLMLCLIAVWRKGSRQAGFFLIAWTAFLVGTVVFVLRDMGVLPYNEWTTYTMPIGSAVEGVLLSFALADRINILRREKERSQAEALATSLENQRIIREQNVILEEKVTERTQALQESNEHLKRTQTQLVNAEKMASLGQLTAGIAHEINNPINFITSNIQPLRRNIAEIVEVMQEYRALTPDTAGDKLKDLKERERKLGIADSIDELDDIIGSISEGSSRTAEIVRGLRNFSRLDEDDLKETDLHEGLRNTLALLAPQYRDKVHVRYMLEDIPPVECFPGKVNQVFMNVLTNAIQAAAANADGTVPEVTISTAMEDDHVCIAIADNGTGMTPEVKARMFDPFFTTKPVGEGTGLGLAIVYGIVEDHRGRITVDTAVGLGTTVRIHLPIRHTRQQQQRA